jgi:hypothetical protein
MPRFCYGGGGITSGTQYEAVGVCEERQLWDGVREANWVAGGSLMSECIAMPIHREVRVSLPETQSGVELGEDGCVDASGSVEVPSTAFASSFAGSLCTEEGSRSRDWHKTRAAGFHI